MNLAAGEQILAEVIRGIFPGDSFSLFLWFMAMMLRNYIVMKCTKGRKFEKSKEKIHHIMYVNDINVLARNEKELEILVQTIRIYSPIIGMEFDTEKYALLIMKSGKEKQWEE